jgi:pimeloyl-ACP methyl ester carboxylesterase
MDEIITLLTAALGSFFGGYGLSYYQDRKSIVNLKRRIPVVEESYFTFERAFSDFIEEKYQLRNFINQDMIYLQNSSKEKGVLVIYLHGLGLDGDDFKEQLLHSKYYGIAPTMFGFHKNLTNFGDSVPIEVHAEVLKLFIDSLIGNKKPSNIILVGFSIGADMILRMLKDNMLSSISGVLLLDPNIDSSTCFLSNELSNIPINDHKGVIGSAVKIAGDESEIEDWLNIHKYLVKVLGKYKNNLDSIKIFSSQVVDAMSESSSYVFSKTFPPSNDRVKYLKAILSGKNHSRNFIEGIITTNKYWGKNYREKDISRIEGKRHFDLIEPAFLESEIDNLVEELSLNT